MQLNVCRFISLLFCGMLALNAAAQDYSAQFRTRASELKPENLAVVVNTQDANSVEVGNYYMHARQVPAQNLIKISFKKPASHQLSQAEFAEIKHNIDAKLNNDIQAVLFVWTTPYAVGCNSITSVYTLGYDDTPCQETSCPTGRNSPYFNSKSFQPLRDHKIRLSMLLPSDDVATAKAVIDRGVLSAFALNEATGYFLKTTDSARSVSRELFFPPDFTTLESKKLRLRIIRKDFLQDKKDVMFYFTGQVHVQFLETLNFMPGAIADHLTSYGGALKHDGQMPATEWLRAGATASYGTVSEPCNYWQKFPNPKVLLNHYLAGETIIESYWKSVKWPAQGLFIGEPLAAPYKQSVMPAKAETTLENAVPPIAEPAIAAP